jgi:CHAT domain-containing protein
MNNIMHNSLIIAITLLLNLCNLSSAFSQDSSNDSESLVYENWLSVTERTYQDYILSEIGTSIYDELSDAYYSLYRETGDTIYLVYALHEAGRGKRDDIKSRLTEPEISSVENTLKKLNDNEVDSAFYEIQSFTKHNIYHFHGLSIPEEYEDLAEKLLEYWYKQLPSTYQSNYLKASFKAQALVIGYFRLGIYNRVYEVGQYLVENHPFPASLFTINLFETIAYSARINGYYLSSLDIYQDILLPIAEELGDTSVYITLRMDYAITLFRIGNVNAALREYEEIYSQIDYLTDSRYRAALFNNLAISYLNTGRFDQYVQFQLNAYEIAREENDYGQQLSILRNLFIYYRRQSDTEMAFSYLDRALQLAQENELSEDIASILISLGIYKRTVENNPKAALEHFYEAADLSEGTNQYHYFYNSLIELAETYHLLENYDKAKKYFEEAILLSQSRNDKRNQLQANVRFANMLTIKEEYDPAARIMGQFDPQDFHQLNFNIRILANNVLLRLFMYDDEWAEAVELSSSIVEEVINWLRESTDHQTGHMRMDEEFSELFRLHSLIMHETGNVENALATAGDLRNISRSGFYNNPLLKSQMLTEEELIKDYNLSNRIQQLRRNYANANEQQRVYLGNELLNAISERNALQSRAFPNYQEVDYSNKLSTIRRSLHSNQAVLFFSVFENQVFQYVITRSDISMNTFPHDENSLTQLQAAIGSVKYGTTDLTLLHEIYTTYFHNSIPSGTNHIYVIPDGDFYRLPIEILPVESVRSPGSYGSSRYLIEEYSVSYINSLSELISSEAEEHHFEYDLAGFGIRSFSDAGHPGLPDLPFSPSEIIQSAEKLDKFSKKIFFLDNESTEANFRNIAGNARILHLATHSKVNDENPLFSSMYLHRELIPVVHPSSYGQHLFLDGDDGIVHAYELFDMNLNADLVFLSSCESGAGGYLEGAGILGFSRAFSYAGAKSLAMNLWPVRDQTAAEISLRFYEALNEGQDKAEALRTARLSYLNNNNSDPFLWGGFVLFGDISSPIEKSSITFTYLYSGGVIVAGIFIILFMIYNKRKIYAMIF